MRATTVLRRILGVTGLIVECSAFTEEGLVVLVRPRWSVPRCGE